MDNPFDHTSWRPLQPGSSLLTSTEIDVLARNLCQQTRSIKRYPYDPQVWLTRANTLEQLQFPELVVGDAWKASVLCDSILQSGHFSGRRGKNKWRLGYRFGFCMLDDAPVTIIDPLQMSTNAMEARLKGIRWLATNTMAKYLCEIIPDQDQPDGTYRRRAYPWMQHKHLIRSDDLLEQINHEFSFNEACDEDGVVYCEVRRRALGRSELGTDTGNVLGVFAGTTFDQGELLLFDRTSVWGCSGSSFWEKQKGCTIDNHPGVIFDGKSNTDLRWIRDQAASKAPSPLLTCRLLHDTVGANHADHPLDHRLIARLTPRYFRSRLSRFSLQNDIEIPYTFLRHIGIDIFADERYDTWVLFTINARVANNCCGSPVADSLFPLFSLINHSCEPNASWRVSTDHSKISVHALRRIEQDEQIFVEYDSFATDMDLAGRRRALRFWLDGGCYCSRCIREEAELEEDRDRKRGGLEHGGSDNVQWDVDEKPVFPEDRFWRQGSVE